MSEDDTLDISDLMRAFGPVPYEPCDSPIEDAFLWDYRKVANDGITFGRQHECKTKLGLFRVDFVVTDHDGKRKVGIECDGRDFHDVASDAKRDAAIVASGVLDKIYRITGSAIHWSIHDALQLLSFAEPWMFSERGREQLEVLAAPEHSRNDSWGWFSDTKQGAVMRSFDPPDDDEYDPDLVLRAPVVI